MGRYISFDLAPKEVKMSYPMFLVMKSVEWFLSNPAKAWMWIGGPIIFMFLTTVFLMSSDNILQNILSPVFGAIFSGLIVVLVILIGMLIGRIWRGFASAITGALNWNNNTKKQYEAMQNRQNQDQ
jgi:hypothetical protein